MDQLRLLRAKTDVSGNGAFPAFPRPLETQAVVYSTGLAIDAPVQPVQNCFVVGNYIMETGILGLQP